jgi:exodeoxyribonuclease VII small subunit
MAKKKTKTDRSGGEEEQEVSFEEALERLEGLVERLEEGEVPLEESLQAYAEGTQLVKLCLERLDRAETVIRELSESTEGLRLQASELESAGDDNDEAKQNDLGF